MAVEDMLTWLERHPEIDSLRAAVCDLNGAMRGKGIPVSQAEKVLRGGLRMPLSAAGVDVWGADVVDNAMVFETGDADGLCEWSGRDILPISWLSKPTALIPLWLSLESGEPFLGDPRRALAAVVARFDAIGLTPVVATEMEFYLVDPAKARPVPPRSPVTGERLHAEGILSLDEIDQFDAFLSDVYTACIQQSIPADAAVAEGGAGQFEINILHTAGALKAADDAVLFKRIVKGIARKHGLAATFMAKPYGERAGNGMHVHFSLIDRQGINVFDDGTDTGSEALLHAIGGLLAAMPESTLLFAPHLNSYRRLRPGSHAPTAVAWGYENRTTAVRVPGGPCAGRRVEHRVAAADANPYLVLTGILGAALEGLEQQTDPVGPTLGDAYSQALPQLPFDWAAAIDRFEHGDIMARVFDPVLRRMLVACKRQELNVFAGHVTDFEYRSYLESV